MTPDEIADTARQFVVAASTINLDTDGLPCDPSQRLAMDINTRLANRLLNVCEQAMMMPPTGWPTRG